ncbi:GDYXXLXY domain-containing protein [Flagellimonas zhangzhouensis]|uniref:Uncharacterized membrane-anchored protein n=1 Tax=Flagellimonas zhangzhouensis TaxID=1073328 RepID=A0A1H2U5M6_9FLAO|nr:GDYXXLXY domain-containing protein [Allomuricauda zhangzhouensis]SDQ19988.1 Uncharacterized membrane-anchored protein [Allomuricauda zhangzhouensis]SDW51513.1 Uncharacterized membrane-anchored protein [Allomuricauda zhangzhouensis]
MDKKKITITLFALVVLAQLFVPAKMIWDQEDVLRSGNEFKFKTAPVDPNDPFRGKYITLSFDHNTVEVENTEDWYRGDEVYAIISNGKDGFARIQSIKKEKPSGNKDYLKAEIGFSTGTANRVSIDFPFDRFYLEESKAEEAEYTYWSSRRDTTKITYALVNIKDGQAVLKDVLIDGVSIVELVNKE